MEPLYKTKTKYDLEEYKKFNYAIATNINKIHIKVIVLELLFILLAFIYVQKSLYLTMTLLLVVLIFPLTMYFTLNTNIKKTFESNKSMKDLEINFEFFKDYCSYNCEMGTTKFEYKDLYKVVETKTNLYLMLAKNQGIILKKDNCDTDLQDFVKNLK